MGLGFGATASCVHPTMVDAEDHPIPEALATCHCALEGECKREETHSQASFPLPRFSPKSLFRAAFRLRTPGGLVPFLTIHGVFVLFGYLG